jgi:hypothetical protein
MLELGVVSVVWEVGSPRGGPGTWHCFSRSGAGSLPSVCRHDVRGESGGYMCPRSPSSMISWSWRCAGRRVACNVRRWKVQAGFGSVGVLRRPGLLLAGGRWGRRRVANTEVASDEDQLIGRWAGIWRRCGLRARWSFRRRCVQGHCLRLAGGVDSQRRPAPSRACVLAPNVRT